MPKTHANLTWIYTRIVTAASPNFTSVKYHSKVVLYKKRKENSERYPCSFKASLCIQGCHLCVKNMMIYGATLVVINALNIILQIYTVSLFKLTLTRDFLGHFKCYHPLHHGDTDSLKSQRNLGEDLFCLSVSMMTRWWPSTARC